MVTTSARSFDLESHGRKRDSEIFRGGRESRAGRIEHEKRKAAVARDQSQLHDALVVGFLVADLAALEDGAARRRTDESDHVRHLGASHARIALDPLERLGCVQLRV